MKVLTYIDAYLPGERAGGPVQTLSAMVQELVQTDFWIVTRNHDLGVAEPYRDVPFDRWTRHGRANVLYLSRGQVTTRRLGQVAREVKPDLVYTHSVFSRVALRYLLARRLRLAPQDPLLIAPRGEFSPGALAIKLVRKRAWLAFSRVAGLYRGATWHASAERERDEIQQTLGAGTRVAVAPNLVPIPVPRAGVRPAKVPGRARFIFVSRISPKKNLRAVIDVLGRLRGDVELDVYGEIEDPSYWAECESAATRLPPNARVNYRGRVGHAEVYEAFAKHDAFVFPTLGENFGHVIFEALISGCPVLVSDTTPWSGLAAKGAGWVLKPSDVEGWAQAMQGCVDMGPELEEMSRSCPSVAVAFTRNEDAIHANRLVFEAAVQSRGTVPRTRT